MSAELIAHVAEGVALLVTLAGVLYRFGLKLGRIDAKLDRIPVLEHKVDEHTVRDEEFQDEMRDRVAHLEGRRLNGHRRTRR